MSTQLTARPAQPAQGDHPGQTMERLTRFGGSILVYVSFIIFAVVIGLPFYFIFISSITPSSELFNIPPTYLPSAPTLENYLKMMESIPFLTYFRNSLIFAIGSSAVSVIAAGMAAYALARIRFPGSNILYLALILSVALPQIAVLVPMYQTFNSFRLVNTPYGLIIMMSSLMLPFTIMTLVSFINQVPAEIEEAAYIDGANTAQIILRVVLPLIRPALFTMFLINFIISWNELLYPLVFAHNVDTKTLSVGLTELTDPGSTYTKPWDQMSALSVFMIVPVLLIILFGQRMIISGLARGALK
ncbi:MAG: carbohydrate ABC transporter permease [Anaerolineae bacterium]|nr:carbohydrate ABC transporter permease [Anaerolineae bacterium]NUQ03068.1 carbohydrate ABC transporter permease [Anaerolineae bacterium]